MSKKMNICFISDNNFVSYLSTCIVSILENSSCEDNFHFHIIEIDITNENKQKIEKLKKIKNFYISYYKSPNEDKYKKIDEHIKKYHLWQQWHYSIFLKLDIPIIFQGIDNILYLDIDQIVLSRLNLFFEFNMDNYYMMNIQLSEENLFWMEADFEQWIIDIGCSKKDYVGGATLFFNLKNIREKLGIDNYNKALDFCVKEYKHIIFTEEHILLYIFRKMIVNVDYNINIIEYFPKSIPDIDTYKIKIIHFVGTLKPLSKNYSGNIDHHYKMFFYYFLKTDFFYEKFVDCISIISHNDLNNLNNRINRLESAIYKITDFIVYIIPIKKIRDNVRNRITKSIKKIIE